MMMIVLFDWLKNVGKIHRTSDESSAKYKFSHNCILYYYMVIFIIFISSNVDVMFTAIFSGISKMATSSLNQTFSKISNKSILKENVKKVCYLILSLLLWLLGGNFPPLEWILTVPHFVSNLKNESAKIAPEEMAL